MAVQLAGGREAPRLVLVGPWPSPWGGIAVHVRALRELAVRHGFAVEVLDVGEGHAARDGSEGVRDAGSYGRFAGELLRMAARDAVLHVHVPGNNTKAWMVACAAAAARPGGLLTVHSGLAPALLESSAASRRLARLAASGYSRVLCANGGIATALERCGVPSRRLQVLPAFVPGALAPGEPPSLAHAARARFGQLLAAALAPGNQYGQDVLLDAMALLRERAPALGMLVYGPGTDAPAFADEVADRGLFGRVVALGEIDQPASLGVMRLSDAFVRPTRADGDSVSVREALGLGVRVVASDVGNRPPDVSLFRAGDPRDLAARIEAALALPPPPEANVAGDASDRILSTWRDLWRARYQGVTT